VCISYPLNQKGLRTLCNEITTSPPTAYPLPAVVTQKEDSAYPNTDGTASSINHCVNLPASSAETASKVAYCRIAIPSFFQGCMLCIYTPIEKHRSTLQALLAIPMLCPPFLNPNDERSGRVSPLFGVSQVPFRTCVSEARPGGLRIHRFGIVEQAESAPAISSANSRGRSLCSK
jgi:hypothetical protein